MGGRVLQRVAGGLPADGAGGLLAAGPHHSGNLHSLDSLRQVQPLPSLPPLHYRAERKWFLLVIWPDIVSAGGAGRDNLQK